MEQIDTRIRLVNRISIFSRIFLFPAMLFTIGVILLAIYIPEFQALTNWSHVLLFTGLIILIVGVFANQFVNDEGYFFTMFFGLVTFLAMTLNSMQHFLF
jgi:hypothetical protein